MAFSTNETGAIGYPLAKHKTHNKTKTTCRPKPHTSYKLQINHKFKVKYKSVKLGEEKQHRKNRI